MGRQLSGFLVASLALAACAGGSGEMPSGPVSVKTAPPPADISRPRPRPGKAVDLTAPETVATRSGPRPSARPEQDLGTTIVSLGLLDRSGLWLRTPLVASEVKGRITYPKTGVSANVLLIPLPGDSGAGSHLSPAAMQVLGIPLGDLAGVQVFVR